jgi:hypothetical protein
MLAEYMAPKQSEGASTLPIEIPASSSHDDSSSVAESPDASASHTDSHSTSVIDPPESDLGIAQIS